jgi:hypothetical protein
MIFTTADKIIIKTDFNIFQPFEAHDTSLFFARPFESGPATVWLRSS